MKTPSSESMWMVSYLGVDQTQPRVADEDSAQQLAEDRGLAEPLRHRSAELGHAEHDHQHREQMRRPRDVPSRLVPFDNTRRVAEPGRAAPDQNPIPRLRFDIDTSSPDVRATRLAGSRHPGLMNHAII